MGFKALPLAALALVLAQGCSSQPLPPPCYEKPDSGRCKAAHTRYFHDPDTGECRAFIWGGCGGNVPFETMEACVRACQASPTESTGGKSPVPRDGASR